ncbi:DUF4190 domain-containing protein [Streptomyces spiramenti]|uniref:DUF4190 domain-containing protein n=1 Tax=Streptomyces spiramenti TaxID=2720606 RepID=UPI001ADDC8BD|nr:DUF4190 domain-containing protein [Streptomyces spiramenti]
MTTPHDGDRDRDRQGPVPGFTPPSAGWEPPPEERRAPGGGGGGNGLGIAALVTGILAALFFWTAIGGVAFGVVALVTGVLGFRRARRGAASNGTMSLVGAVIGGLGLLGGVLVLLLGVAVWNSEEFGNLRECVDAADTQEELDRCDRDFQDEVGD